MPRIDVRVTDKQKAEIQRRAEAAGKTVSAYIKAKALPPSEAEVAAAQRVEAQIKMLTAKRRY